MKFADAGIQATPSTSMSAFIHITRLRRIESEIQQSVYRLDEPNSMSETDIDKILGRLEEWKSKIPTYTQSIVGSDNITFDGRDSFVRFHKNISQPLN